MRNNGNRVWRGVMGVAPLAVLVLGGVAAAEPMAGTSSDDTSAAPVCKDSGVTVNFKTGSSDIDRNGQGALSGVATWVQNGDQRTVRLEGHADKRGNATTNQRLSEKRAQAAEDFLVGKGVTSDKITVSGHGEETAVSDNADARVVNVKTCDVPKKVAEATPPPEPVMPPEPIIPPEPAPPVAVTPPPAPAPPPEPMFEPVPVAVPVAVPVHHPGPPSVMGIEASVGGGAVGFIDSAVRSNVNTGGAWDARMTFGSRLPVAIEGAYVGSAQNIDALGLSTNSHLVGNGVEGDLRLNFTNYKVQPYIFGGAGWTRYQIYNSALNTSDISSRDDVGTVPLGAGISIRPAQVFLIDVRGTYRAVFNDTMFNQITNTNNSMQNWNVAGRVGFEF
jgi:outer membrane protein OmpA-like peptidoglycan-associated protein